MCTYGTCSYSYVMIVIHHKSLCSIISPCDVHLWDPSPSNMYLWDLQYSSMMLAICHKSLRSVLSPSDVYLRDPSASDLWDPMTYVSRVPVGPFSISIQPVGPDGLRVTCTRGTIRPVGPDGSRVTCTYGTFLHLHPTCGTQRLTYHLYLLCRRDLIN